jgi:hypothetical protein
MFSAHAPKFFRTTFCLLASISVTQCAGQIVAGIVNNATSGTAQSGDLILLKAGSRELGRAISGELGGFRIQAKQFAGISPNSLKLQVLHDGVSYQQPIKIGIAANLKVFDASAHVDGLSEYLSIFQFEARVADRMEITELHAIQNNSWPPRTRVDAENFDLPLPEGAHNLLVTIAEPDGQGARLSIPDFSKQHDPYRLGVPLKPGMTKYVLTYQLPYSGELPFRRIAQYSTKKTFVVLSSGMSFSAPSTLRFHPVPDSTGAQVREIDSLAKHDVLAFRVAGTGVLAQAFRLIGGPDQSIGQTNQPSKVQPLSSDTSPTPPVSTSSNQKVSPSAAHSEPHPAPMITSVRSWTVSAFVLLMLGSFIAWKVLRVRSRHRSA